MSDLRRGNEMDVPLQLWLLADRAEQYYPYREIHTRTVDGIETITYAQLAARARRMGEWLKAEGVSGGDTVATFAWNTARHLVSWFGITSIGAVCHTVNPRLSPSEIEGVLADGGAKLALVDPDLAGDFPQLNRSVALDQALDDELDRIPDPGIWPEFDERTAAVLCHTSGTTGAPKGVLFSHRAMVLQAIVHGHTDVHGLSERDVVMPVVPMFHAVSWAIPWAATVAGTAQVMPGPAPKARDLIDLIRRFGVTYTAAVPAVWHTVVEESQPGDLATVRRVCSGGSPLPRPLLEGLLQRAPDVQQGYGMTETGPLAMRTHPKSHLEVDHESAVRLRSTQGLPSPLTRVKVVAADGTEVPRDGATPGEVMFRSPWVMDTYLGADAPATRGGWLPTGDLAVVDDEGYVTIVDRVKDLIKTGGEWVSSVDLEARILADPAVGECAVVGRPHPKWGERPVAYLVPRPGHTPDPAKVKQMLAAELAAWQVPDEFLVVDDLPRTSVGKIDKKALRGK